MTTKFSATPYYPSHRHVSRSKLHLLLQSIFITSLTTTSYAHWSPQLTPLFFALSPDPIHFVTPSRFSFPFSFFFFSFFGIDCKRSSSNIFFASPLGLLSPPSLLSSLSHGESANRPIKNYWPQITRKHRFQFV